MNYHIFAFLDLPVVYRNGIVGYLPGCQYFEAAPPHRVRLDLGPLVTPDTLCRWFRKYAGAK